MANLLTRSVLTVPGLDTIVYAIKDPAGTPVEGKMALSELATLYATAAQGVLASTALQDAPNNGSQYARQNGAWAVVTGGVASVFGRTGTVVAVSGDYSAGLITNAPAGGISAVTVQAAINELDTEKQPLDADLTTLAALAHADGNIIVSDGAAWVVESGATARASLGLGTIATQNANNVTISGGSVTGITDLAIADGGTGQSTAQLAINALTAVSGATNEHVLTKDTATGNAIFKAVAAGVTSVFTRTGAVVSANGDYTASQVTNVAAGNIAGVTVQAALNELDSEKAGLALANVFTTGQTINPGTDTNELILKAHSTKTTPFVLLRNSSNTELMRIDTKNLATVVLMGFEAGRDVTGADNTLIGWRSGRLMTSATFNTAFGSNTLGAESASPSTGGSNTAFGAYSLRKLTTGTFNVGFGTSTLQELTTGDANLAIGRLALGVLVSGSSNVAIGSLAAEDNTASNNTVIGFEAGANMTSGGTNTVIGYRAGKDMSSASFCVFIGSNAGQTETGFSKLYISNISTLTPLIYGEFTNGILKFHTYLNTDVVTDTLSLIKKRISGTPAAGLGTALRFALHSSTTEDQHAARISAEWVVATHASRTARAKWTVYDTAEREGIRIEASGSAPMLGVLGATAIARQAHIADPSGGGTQDAEARTAINAILLALESFGFLATS